MKECKKHDATIVCRLAALMSKFYLIAHRASYEEITIAWNEWDSLVLGVRRVNDWELNMLDLIAKMTAHPLQCNYIPPTCTDQNELDKEVPIVFPKSPAKPPKKKNKSYTVLVLDQPNAQLSLPKGTKPLNTANFDVTLCNWIFMIDAAPRVQFYKEWFELSQAVNQSKLNVICVAKNQISLEGICCGFKNRVTIQNKDSLEAALKKLNIAQVDYITDLKAVLDTLNK